MFVKKNAKILVLNPFPIYPPISGGQGRVFHLYKHVARYFDVVILCFADRRSYKTISPGLQQILVPKTSSHCQMELEFHRKAGFYSCAVVTKAASLTPEYAHIAKEQSKDACMVILSHPYLYDEAAKTSGTRRLIYDAHNVEYDLHQSILPDSLSTILDDIQEAEQATCEQSHLIATCSEEDSRTLARLYHIPRSKFIVVPNGADTMAIPFVAYEQRQPNKAALGITHPLAIYMGSNFPPNVTAGKQVIEIAKKLPEVRFWLIGSFCEAFTGLSLPVNIDLLGILSEQEKNRILHLADIAVNPALEGSGTNLKMLEYMAAGIPIVTTLRGARGIREDYSNCFIISKCEDMPFHIRQLLSNPLRAADLAERAFALTRTKFDWKHIADNFSQKLTSLL